MGFVEIPAGKFLMGEGASQHEVELPRYFISRFPVTVAQYRAFVVDTGYDADPLSLGGLANHPVVYVSWHDALAYCAWLQERLLQWGQIEDGWAVTLPSEAEWEKAARGGDGRKYPWGEDADPERANYDETGISDTSTVGCFPRGAASSYGCEEMSGNVLEWTRSIGKYPYVKDDGGEDFAESSEILRVLRGGSSFNNSRDVRCAVRLRIVPDYRNYDVGFRVVLSPFSSGL